MKKPIIFAMSIAVVLSLGACNSGQKTKTVEDEVEKEVIHDGHDHEGHDHDGHEHGVEAGEETAVLCAGCGQVKGSDKCCVEGVEKCDKCNMEKGSPGCCKITQDTELCGHCGEIATSEYCCKEGADVCTACGLHVGSPGCCSI